MPEEMQAFNNLVALLTYPGEDYLSRAHQAQAELAVVHPEAGQQSARFFSAVKGLSTEELQELFTRTFDLNPACVLEIGWQLFGDEYKRGEFLVKMQQLIAGHRAPASKELPDHLPRVLELMPRLKSQEAERLTAEFVLPALAKMLAGLVGKDNPYEDLLKVVQVAVTACYIGPAEEVRRD